MDHISITIIVIVICLSFFHKCIYDVKIVNMQESVSFITATTGKARTIKQSTKPVKTDKDLRVREGWFPNKDIWCLDHLTKEENIFLARA